MFKVHKEKEPALIDKGRLPVPKLSASLSVSFPPKEKRKEKRDKKKKKQRVKDRKINKVFSVKKLMLNSYKNHKMLITIVWNSGHLFVFL